MRPERCEEDVREIRAHTRGYQTDEAFLREWGGLSSTDVELRTQQQRVFVKLLGGIWDNLRGKRILDVGCGDGRWLRWFVELGALPCQLLGIDVSDVGFIRGRQKNPLVQMQRADGWSIPAADQSFDLVTQWVCFMCMPSREMRVKVAAEMLRVLRPGGYVFWWDVTRTIVPGHASDTLAPEDYFVNLSIVKVRVPPRPRPSDGLRPLRGFRRHIGRAIDRLGYRPTHIAALIGPKA